VAALPVVEEVPFSSTGTWELDLTSGESLGEHIALDETNIFSCRSLGEVLFDENVTMDSFLGPCMLRFMPGEAVASAGSAVCRALSASSDRFFSSISTCATASGTRVSSKS
jgi:hypothetical protein